MRKIAAVAKHGEGLHARATHAREFMHLTLCVSCKQNVYGAERETTVRRHQTGTFCLRGFMTDKKGRTTISRLRWRDHVQQAGAGCNGYGKGAMFLKVVLILKQHILFETRGPAYASKQRKQCITLLLLFAMDSQ